MRERRGEGGGAYYEKDPISSAREISLSSPQGESQEEGQKASIFHEKRKTGLQAPQS